MKNNQDLPDSENDKLHLKQEETIIELPDVEDIPGQEHIKVPPFSEFADTTISSAGEEGDALFSQNEIDNNVSETERELLQQSASQSSGNEDDKNIKIIALDKFDEDGAPLNEGNLSTDHFGEDLDLPAGEEVDEED